MQRARPLVALLLLIPAARFTNPYIVAARNAPQRDTAMDRDSRDAAELVRRVSHLGDTLFVWGYRPELFVYTGLPAATMYLGFRNRSPESPPTGTSRNRRRSRPPRPPAAGQRSSNPSRLL